MINFCLFLLLLCFCFKIYESVNPSCVHVPSLCHAFFAFHFCNFLFAIPLFCFFSVEPCSVPHKTRVVIGVAAKEPLSLPPSFRNQNLQ